MKRIAVVDNDKLKDADKQRHIQSLCPVNRAGTECIKIENGRLFIDEATCIGCGICAKHSDGAIKIVNLPTSAEGDPIHRFGENGFALYSLPTPLFGKVVGILGPNGIGKSTALNILAGHLIPNFGSTQEEQSQGSEKSEQLKRLIGFFKGSEAQGFFEKLASGEIKVAYKPQHVDLIPKAHTGTVRDLLLKADETDSFDRITELLELKDVLDTEISKVSGGELQRIAIAATVMKRANVYIFDEPTSYLDIQQRIKVSKFIRGLATEETAVLVVEHDLIILDFLTDLVHIMYGKPGAFGVVSGVKPTRTGINIYLSGYLKEENVRFRDHAVHFMAKPPADSEKNERLVAWKDLSVQLGRFRLSADEGEIMQHQVIGVLGPNGIGKTTFVKILAGVQKPDTGEISDKVKVSYKPQYLEPTDEPVASAARDVISKYDVQLARPLGIHELLDKKLSDLSGGELQRVAIAVCLAREADLYLLDEPSAYLDVEQRLLVSKVIRDVMETRTGSALVVDHDLLFVDYLSESLIVLEGTPAKEGAVKGPFTMEEGMNRFLSRLSITLRRDMESKRPRINKEDSRKDREQRAAQKWYYS
ncbi:ribosome biogenesis/translation initiation ATPase RLI [Candidatus Woesearchaeota archaeon]|nr:MAG: ribosome biogenesis/translation initiation ATPase RLI [Candidatus Woesearchaeota archaeon]